MVAALLFAPGHPKTCFFEIYEILLNFLKFDGILWNFWNFTQIPVLRAPWSARLFNPCFFLRNIKVSWRVADGWEHKNSWFSLKIIEFPEISWNFINFINFPQFHQFSALRCWHAKRTVIPMPFQWLQRSCFLPGHPKICFSWKYWFQTKILGIFMKFYEI